ncbi:hypothetical protein LSH36_296g00027 [Paralvinella palmiformis]|uniref:Uncharacterized protein n=1 Tax=Paralvinella palmiformis TaxID=53620 RepID=A0AAD9JHV5_9ANNE|nr:hypothetical protein LSH36_296g00027 [Paralvinella palmiformis]
MSEGNEETRRQETIHRLVNNRNNLEALFLKRTLVSYEKELFIIIKRLDDEKLDWMEVNKTLREHPPSPIELSTPACIRANIPFPLLPQNVKHSLTNPSGSDADGSGTMRMSRTATTRDLDSRSRLQDVMKEDLRGDHTVTRKDADLDKLVLPAPNSTTSSAVRVDILTKLPSIQQKSKSSRNHRTASGLGARTENPSLLKSATDIDLGRRVERLTPRDQPVGGQLTAGREKSHVSTSDIPDTLMFEAKDLAQLSVGDGKDCRLTPRLLSDRRRTRRARTVKPLGERVGDFYKRFDTWLVEGSNPNSRPAIGEEMPDVQLARDHPHF